MQQQETRGKEEPRSWRDARFDAQPARRRRGLPSFGALITFVVVANLFVLLAAIQHDETRCDQDCFDTGLRTYEPGHPWTSYDGAWQWEAMFILGIAAFVVAVVAAVAAWHAGAATRSARVSTAAAVALGVAWIVWRVLAPPVVG